MKINSFRLNRIKVWEPSQARAVLDAKRFPSFPASLFEAAPLHIQRRSPSRSRASPLHSPNSLQLFTFSLTLPLVVSSHLCGFFLFLLLSPSSFFPALLDAFPRGSSFPPLLAWIIIFNNVSKYFCPAVKVKARKVSAKNGGDGARSFWWTRRVRGIEPGSDNPFYLGCNFQ